MHHIMNLFICTVSYQWFLLMFMIWVFHFQTLRSSHILFWFSILRLSCLEMKLVYGGLLLANLKCGSIVTIFVNWGYIFVKFLSATISEFMITSLIFRPSEIFQFSQNLGTKRRILFQFLWVGYCLSFEYTLLIFHKILNQLWPAYELFMYERLNY